jgi:hypothetical protein
VAVNGSVAGLVLVLVAVLALVVKPPAPPGIAAFAPQAAKPITKAPPNQSSNFGNQAGQCAAGLQCGHPKPTPTHPVAVPTAKGAVAVPTNLGVPSALQCYTWPDGTITQTFDPQSPPCIASWDDRKGNGGSTSPGVSGTEIRVAMPVNNTLGPSYPGLKPIVDFLNSHFQFYGRKIVIDPVVSQTANAQGSGTFNDPSMERADAEAITQRKVFASTDFVDPISYSWSLPVFRDVLAKHKIVSLNGGEMTPYGTAEQMAGHAPYEWSYYPTIDTVIQHYAAAVCRQLVGKPAAHASQASLRKKIRKFDVMAPSDDKIGGPLPGLSKLLRILDGCGVHDPKVIRYTQERSDISSLGAAFQKEMQAGVTSVLFFPFSGDSTPQSPPTVAYGLNWNPEWVLMGWNNYLTATFLSEPTSEAKGAFGVGAWNLFLPVADEFWVQSFVAGGGDPGVVQGGTFPGGRGFYQEMLLLASGIQLAGPHLTPETFAQGLSSSTFPNPGAGAAPFHQATVGFGPGDVAMTNDYLEFWLDTRMSGTEVTHTTNVDTYRAMCQVQLGRRWSEETFPASDGYYSGACR